MRKLRQAIENDEDDKLKTMMKEGSIDVNAWVHVSLLPQ